MGKPKAFSTGSRTVQSSKECYDHGIEDCLACAGKKPPSKARETFAAALGASNEPAVGLHSDSWRTLWRAKLSFPGSSSRSEFLFRSINDFETASAMAVKLLESSTYAEMSHAVIDAVERVARLWN